MATSLTRSTLGIEDNVNTELVTVQNNVEAFGQTIEAAAAAANVAALAADSVTVGSEYSPTSVNKRIFVANRAYKVSGFRVGIDVIGSDAGAVTVGIEKVPSGTALGAGTALLTAGVDLKSTVDTTVAGALVASAASLTLAVGDAIALDFGASNLAAAIGITALDLIPV